MAPRTSYARSRQKHACEFTPADDFSRVLCQAVSPLLMSWRDSHFRPDPAHMVFCPC